METTSGRILTRPQRQQPWPLFVGQYCDGPKHNDESVIQISKALQGFEAGDDK